MGEMIAIDAPDGAGRFDAYRADPAGDARAAVIVIQEIFGLNPGIRKKCDDWAALGYVALAPDMFWRIEPGFQADPDQPDERKRAFGMIGRFDPEQGIADIAATIRVARALAGGGKVGLVGFCLGGRMAYLAATRTDVDASVGYYGAGIDKLLGERHAIARPLMLHFGENDGHITPEIVATVRAGLDANDHVVIHTYPDAGHGFATSFGERRDDAAAEQADARTETLFASALA